MALEMEGNIPDVVGLLLEDAVSLLAQNGLQASYQVKPENKRIRVLRQRVREDGTIDLTLGYEMYNDPSLEEKEVKLDAL